MAKVKLSRNLGWKACILGEVVIPLHLGA